MPGDYFKELAMTIAAPHNAAHQREGLVDEERGSAEL